MFQWELKLKNKFKNENVKNFKIELKHDKMLAHSLEKAINLLQDLKFAKFDESVDLAINLDVDPRHAEQNIRVTTPLPHGTGKKFLY